MSILGLARTAYAAAADLLVTLTEARRQMRAFQRLTRTSDAKLAALGLSREDAVSRIMGLPSPH